MIKFASPEEVQSRVAFTDRAYELGIDLYAYDGEFDNIPEDEVRKHKIDVNDALVLLYQGKEVPMNLEERLLSYKVKYSYRS